MRQIVLILTSLVAILALERPAAAQVTPKKTVQERISEDMVRWVRLLNRVDKQLKAEDLTVSNLGELKATVDEARRQLNGVRNSLSIEAHRFEKLIDALGPPPKEGKPPESSETASQRDDLNAQAATAKGRLKNLDLLLERTRSLLTEISVARRKAFGDQLLVRTPSLISFEIWSKTAAEFVRLLERAVRSPLQWYQSPQVRSAVDSGYFAVVLIAVVAAAGLGLFFRRWLVRGFGRDRTVENPTYRMRVRAALAEGVARTVIPILVVAATYAALLNGGLLVGLFKYVTLAFVVSVVIFSILNGLPRAMLSPTIPQWRLANLGDYSARLWYRYAFTLAAIVGLDLLLIIPTAELRPSPTLVTTYNFIIGTAYSLVFLLMATDKRLWRTPEDEARASGQRLSSPDQSAPRKRWWLVGRALVAILALAIPIAALAGYGVLSDFIARRLLATAAVFLIILVLYGLARDLIAIFTRDTKQPPAADEKANLIYVWSVLVLDIGLVLTMAFVLVPLWGGHWDSILDRTGWSLSGFKIGARVFSITDVLAGMATFVILIALVRTLQRFVDTRILKYARIDTGVRDALRTGIGYTGLVIAVLVAIDTTGIDLSGLAFIAGALSVGVGFGLQGVVNNFVSGLVLLAERPIKVGDWVEVGQHEGNVKRISVRSTEIKTFSRASVIVPNSELISKTVVNWMHKDRSGRIEIAIGVAYGSDVQQVRDILLQCAADNQNVQRAPEPHVLFRDFGDSALLFELRFFVGNVEARLQISSDIRFAIDEAFRQADITIPFPQRQLHITDAGDLVQAVSRTSAKASSSA